MSETPLARTIRGLIAANGPMSVADYMALCLGDPRHGYYMTRDPLGTEGDFTTAPEISQMFGEIVGAWLIDAWRRGGEPSPALLVELGPGRGTLMSDIFRVADRVPGFRDAVSVHLVETSPALRRRQAATLDGRDIAWRENLADVPDGPLFLVANEFFDALPIRQFVRAGGAWRERVIGLDGERLAFGLGPATLPGAPDAPEGAVLELRPAGEAIAADIARRIAAHGGAALVIDYGHAASAFGDTLQAVCNHAYADPLDSPGEADLTAHVDFAALARVAREAGATAHGPIAQGEFLLALGLLERAGQLGASGDQAKLTVRTGVERLTSPQAMGQLFKVMAITHTDMHPPPFAVAV